MLLRDIPNVREGTLIDVRSREEYELCHARNTINIPWYLHLYYLDELQDLPKPWIFCCEEGLRSGFVVHSLKMLGYEQIFNVGRWVDIEREMNALEENLLAA